MQIPEGYLEGEIRDGFYIESMMKKTWAAQMKVLMEVDRVCKKNNIQYFADWGTLLGAVRHQGFVPWDDDMDITMKRPDYNKFCSIAEKEMPGYNIVNIHTDEGWEAFTSRIVNGKRIRFSKEEQDEFYGCPYIVGLDIFPLDYVAPDKEEDEISTQHHHHTKCIECQWHIRNQVIYILNISITKIRYIFHQHGIGNLCIRFIAHRFGSFIGVQCGNGSPSPFYLLCCGKGNRTVFLHITSLDNIVNTGYESIHLTLCQ